MDFQLKFLSFGKETKDPVLKLKSPMRKKSNKF